jgi:hypothetical protein
MRATLENKKKTTKSARNVLKRKNEVKEDGASR